MDYILNLKESDTAFGNHSLAVLKIARLGIPTVPHPFCLIPRAFSEYMTTDDLSEKLEQELSEVYNAITVNDYKANIRTPDIKCKEFPNLTYQLHNKLKIETKEDFVFSIKKRFQVIKKIVLEHAIKEIEVSVLLQSTYDSHLCGIVQTDDGLGKIRMEAAFGQTTNIISREGIEADIYILNKKTQDIEKKIGNKEYEFVFTKSGVEKKKILQKKQKKQVFTDDIIRKFGEYAITLEDTYGPQEFECAVTTRDIPLIQETRKMERLKKEQQYKSIEVIYPSVILGIVINVSLIEELPKDCSDKIIVVDSLDLDLITLLAYKFRPKGIILKKGALTAHASTILREAKIPSIIHKKADFTNGTEIKLSRNGSYEILT